MKIFLKKILSWMLFLIATSMFFWIPVMIQSRTGTGHDSINGQDGGQISRHGERDMFFEFTQVPSRLLPDDTTVTVTIDTRSDSTEKWISLFVNSERRDMKMVSGDERVIFSGVGLRSGQNEIAAVFHVPTGETLAVRRARISF